MVRYDRMMVRTLPWLCCLTALACVSACKDDDPMAVAPKAQIKEPIPKAPRDAALDAAELPKVTEAGVLLFDQKAAVQQSASWPIGDGETTLVGKSGAAKDKGDGLVHLVRGDKATEVIRCADKEFDSALFIKAYLQSRDVVFVVCESPHEGGKGGRSVGVRLQWKDGDVAAAGRFENEGPPAYETMDFGEEDFVPGTD